MCIHPIYTYIYSCVPTRSFVFHSFLIASSLPEFSPNIPKPMHEHDSLGLAIAGVYCLMLRSPQISAIYLRHRLIIKIVDTLSISVERRAKVTSLDMTTTTDGADVCPKCGAGKKFGKHSCCARGGAWFKKCGNTDEAQFDHTWTEGIRACEGFSNLITVTSPPQAMYRQVEALAKLSDNARVRNHTQRRMHVNHTGGYSNVITVISPPQDVIAEFIHQTNTSKSANVTLTQRIIKGSDGDVSGNVVDNKVYAGMTKVTISVYFALAIMHLQM